MSNPFYALSLGVFMFIVGCCGILLTDVETYFLSLQTTGAALIGMAAYAQAMKGG